MSKTQSQRLAYGEELVALGYENKDVVVLEADLGKSTMSNLFQQEFPELSYDRAQAVYILREWMERCQEGGDVQC